jgi:hypothetical protein
MANLLPTYSSTLDGETRAHPATRCGLRRRPLDAQLQGDWLGALTSAAVT